MSISSMSRVVHDVRQAVLRRDGDDARDEDLLARFVRDQDGAAFEMLAQKHGRMVMGVCRRVLGHCQDAEDAFQATFLVLVRKAASVATPDLLANWLYGVAYHTSLKAKTLGAKRRARERLVPQLPDPIAPEPKAADDLRPLLDHELSRLPDKYRLPILLCDLEGKTRREAAHQLGWLEGTVSGRLSRARVLLAKRLTRRGVVLSAGGVAVLLSEAAVSATEVPAALLATTTQSACLTATGQAGVAGVITQNVAELTQGVLKAMFLKKVKLVVLSSALFLMAASAVMVFVPAAIADRTAQAQGERERGREAGESPVTINGKVLEAGKDKKSIVLEARPENRGDEPKRVTYKLNDKTEITYYGVHTGGATLTEGQIAQIVLVKDSTDTAAKVMIRAVPPEGTGRSMSGPVSEVSEDGKKFAIEISTGRDPNAEKKKFEFAIGAKTEVKYLYVAKDGAKPTVGYHVQVWIDPGSRDGSTPDSITKVQFIDPKRGREMAVNGTLASVSNDGQTLTILTASQDRRNEPGKKVEVKLAKEADVTYWGVGPDGAVATEGMHVNAWLVDGTKDTAEKVVFTKPGIRGR